MSEEKNNEYTEKGPMSYNNWTKYTNGEELTCVYEFPLYTDVRIIGEASNEIYGPYKLINTILGDEKDIFKPAILLRAEYHIDLSDIPNMSKTDTSNYHGGDLSDEIASLISLCLGIKLYAGKPTRYFSNEGDPKGEPEFSQSFKYNRDLEKRVFKRTILPYSRGQFNISDIKQLSSYVNLSNTEAAALIKAARLYQDAVWVADSEPEIAWLFFVSSIETAAHFESTQQYSDVEKLKECKTELYSLLFDKGGEDFVKEVANIVAPTMGATKTFRDFLLKYYPGAPANRPNKFEQFEWEEQNIKKAINIIYNHRSKALHGGTPFPYPMCRLPNYSETPTFCEKPRGLASSANGGVWKAKECPMHLHVFEYIVRHSLLKWWKDMVAKKN